MQMYTYNLCYHIETDFDQNKAEAAADTVSKVAIVAEKADAPLN